MKDPKLLEKYWNAETSLEEEALLHAEAETDSSPEAAYFKVIASARQARSRLTPDAIMQPAATTPPKAPVVRPITRWMAAAAAVFALAIAGYGLWNYSHQVSQPPALMAEAYMAETFDDPEAALAEVRQALAYMSTKLNRSQEQAITQIRKAGEYADIIK